MRFFRLPYLLLVIAMAALAALGFAAAQTPTPESSTADNAMHPGLPELQGVPRDQKFDHFRGGQFSVADMEGNVVTYVVTFGTVANVSGTSLSVTPNGGGTAMTFSITSNTAVHARPARGSLQALVQDDRVVVLSRQGSDEAVMVSKPMGRFHHGRGKPF